MTILAIQLGQKARPRLTLTHAEVQAHARITGDFNPLCFDPVFAVGTKVGRLVIRGGSTAGILRPEAML